MAVYPQSIKIWPNRQDNYDDVMAEHVNSLQEEVTAIERTLGINPHRNIFGFLSGNYTSVADRLNALQNGKDVPFISGSRQLAHTEPYKDVVSETEWKWTDKAVGITAYPNGRVRVTQPGVYLVTASSRVTTNETWMAPGGWISQVLYVYRGQEEDLHTEAVVSKRMAAAWDVYNFPTYRTNHGLGINLESAQIIVCLPGDVWEVQHFQSDHGSGNHMRVENTTISLVGLRTWQDLDAPLGPLISMEPPPYVPPPTPSNPTPPDRPWKTPTPTMPPPYVRPPMLPPSMTVETQTYTSSWHRSWRGSGTIRTDTIDAMHGYWDSNRRQITQIGFPSSLWENMQDREIASMTLYLYAHHWWYYAGGTAILGIHNNATAPANKDTNIRADLMRVPGWKRGQGKTLDITSWAYMFKGGGAKGILLAGAGGDNREFYGRFHGSKHATHKPTITVTYK